MTWSRTRRLFFLAAIAATLSSALASAQAPEQPSKKPSVLDQILGHNLEGTGGWLFIGSKKSGETGIYMALSKDGYNWAYVSDGKPVVRQSERNELMLDPFVLRDPDGTFHMVWTWSTSSPAIGYASSNDLLHWTRNRKLPIAAVPGAVTATSPSVYYRESKKDWLILWTSSFASAGTGSPTQDRIYYSTTADFKSFTPATLFFDPGYSVTDASLLGSGMPGLFYLIFTDERPADPGDPPGKRIYAAEGPSMTGPWQRISEPIAAPWSEAPAPIQVADGLLVYYHRAHNPQDITHDPQDYGAAFTRDMTHWNDESLRIAFPNGIHHGNFLHITTDEYNTLHHFFLRFDTGLDNEK